MKSFFPVFILFCSLFSFLNTGGDALSAESRTKEILVGLKAAKQHWLENASFCGNFTVKNSFQFDFDSDLNRLSFFKSEEEAMTGEIKDDKPQTGFMAKRGNKYRLQTNVPDDTETRDPDWDNGPHLLYTVWIANDRFCFSLARCIDGSQSRPFFASDDENFLIKLSGEPGAVLSENSVNQPFPSPFAFFCPKIDVILDNADNDWTCSELENGRVLLTATVENPYSQYIDASYAASQPQYKVTDQYELTVRTDLGEPLLEQVRTTSTTTYENGKMDANSRNVSTFKVLEWKNCGGINVPSRVRNVGQGTSGISGRDEVVWFAHEWQSDDLGEREPNDDDFKLEVKPTDRFAHLKAVPKDNVIDIDAITDNDYDPAEPKPETAAGTGRASVRQAPGRTPEPETSPRTETGKPARTVSPNRRGQRYRRGPAR